MKQNTDPATYKKCLGFLFNYLIDRKLKHLREYVSKDEDGYDIGAGFGQYTDRMDELEYDVVAIEPDYRYIKNCKSTYVPVEAEDVWLRKDYAYMFNVLHHCSDPNKTIRHVTKIAKKVIISELNRKNIIVWLYVKLFIRHENIEDHYSRDDIREMLRQNNINLTKVFSTSLLGIPFVYNWFVIGDLKEN